MSCASVPQPLQKRPSPVSASLHRRVTSSLNLPTHSAAAGGACDKCNLAQSDGGCKCDSNCNCLTNTCLASGGGGDGPTTTTPSTSSGTVLYSSSGTQSGTYYYSTNTNCPSEPNGYAETDGYPSCASYAPGPDQQTIRQIGSNNIVAIDSNLLGGDRAKYCGKEIQIFHNGSPVASPDGQPYFVWDGCDACQGGSRIDLSVNGLRLVDSNACDLGVVPGVTWQVTDRVIKTFVA